MTKLSLRVGLCGAAVALCACAGAGAGQKGPQRPALAFAAPPASATHYQSDPPAGDALRGPHAVRVGRGITSAAAAHGGTLTPDARLADLAQWTADALSTGSQPPPYSVLDFWARHLGLIEPTPLLLVLQQGDASQLDYNVQTDLMRLLPRQPYTHYGAATFDRDGAVLAVVALSARLLSLSPIARSVTVGTRVTLQGELQSEVREPVLVVSLPDGTSTRSAIGKSKRFSLPVATEQPGEHRVELLANSALGTTVIANFPLYVGVAPPRSITLDAPATEGVLTTSEVNARLLDLINQDRKGAGLLPLSTRAELSAVALAHSTDMHEHDFVGHTSPQTGSAADRMAKAGIRTHLMLENIGRSYSPEEIHRGLMDSPGHRANVLHRDATHVGLGTVVEPEEGATAYLVTEVFARLSEKIEPEAAIEQLFSAINHKRESLGLSALATMETMQEACENTARAFFGSPKGTTNQALVSALSQKASKQRLPYTRLSALMIVVTTIDEAAALNAVLDPKARGIAIGVAQGTRADTPQGAIVVAALIGY